LKFSRMKAKGVRGLFLIGKIEDRLEF